MLSPTTIKKLEKLAKVGDIGIADELNALENRLEGLEAIVPVLREAEDGYTPIKGVDYFDGEPGKDYILTKKDKQDIAESIPVPIVEKVIEKTETVIKEVPIITNEIVEVAVINPDELPQYGVKFRDGLELLQGEERLKATAIDGLDKEVTDRAISIVDNRTSYLINRINNLPTTGGASAFTALTDVPSSYAGQATKIVKVNATEDGLEFGVNSASVSWGGITGTLTDQTDLNTVLNNKEPLKGADDNYVTDAEKTKLANLSGVNTGDQDLSGYSLTSHNHTGVYEPADATILKDADIGVTVAAVLGVDDNYVTDAEKTKLSNLSGTNTGDQVIPDQLSDLTDDSTHRLVTDAEKTTWNAKQSALTADVDYLTPTTAGTTYEPKKGTDDNFVTDAEKTKLSNLSGTNTGDQTIKDTFGITVDGAGTALTTGTKGYRYIEQNCTVTGWHVRSDISGSVVFDVKRSGVSLAGTEKPTLSATTANSDLALSTWTTSLVAGDIIEFVIDSASTLTRATLTVLITKT